MKSVEWLEDRVRLIDQTKLPNELIYHDCRTPEDVAEAIASMRVRGAPAIGVAAGFGLALAARRHTTADIRAWLVGLECAAEALRSTRPTAVNLPRAIDRVLDAATAASSIADGQKRVLAAARSLAEEDLHANRQIGRFGATLIPDRANVLTHCNTGALATTEYGTALGVIRNAHENGKAVHVWVDETRPALQGARLTAWELLQCGIPHTIVADSAAAYLMQLKKVDLVLVGADRISIRGDVANKVGTYGLAVLARAHDIPFYVVAPTSTIDPRIADGAEIPIEERNPDEIRRVGGVAVAPRESPALNFAFDVTPRNLVTAIVTDLGIAYPPFERQLAEFTLGLPKAV